MPRRRTLAPEYFRDRRMGQLGPSAGTVYQALWCWADDGGVCRADPQVLKGDPFLFWPTIGISEIIDGLARLAGAKRILLYAVGDELYAEIPKLADYPISHPSKFRYPRGGERVSDVRGWLSGQLTPETLRTPSGDTPPPLAVSRKPVAVSREPLADTSTDHRTTSSVGAGDAPVESSEAAPTPTLATSIAVAANRALHEKLAGACRLLRAEQLTDSHVEQLVTAGVTADLASEIIPGLVAGYRGSDKRDRQPSSLAYFVVPLCREAERRALGSNPAQSGEREAVERIGAYHARATGNTDALFTDERRARLARLWRETGGDTSLFMFAADGIAADEWARTKGKTTLEDVYRNLGELERLAKLGGWKPGKKHRHLTTPIADAA